MNKISFPIALIMVLALLIACEPESYQSTQPPQSSAQEPSGELSYLHPNRVETSLPIYGGTLTSAINTPSSFDGHRKVSYGPCATLPVFNQLVMFDLAYKDTVPETIVGDLAESWQTSPDGTEITFNLHKGVKWHDGVPFTADDVVYSLDKMNDINRSAIADFFPAYESTEKVDDNTVKVHLKYASAGFMISLAQGYCVIEAKHLSATDDQSADFMVGTGPFILEEYLVRIHLKYKRNPDYFKKDKYGNQLPYLDHLVLADTGMAGDDVFVARRLDVRSQIVSASTVEAYDKISLGAPEALFEPKYPDSGCVFFVNLAHKPLDDIRIRRAMSLVIDEQNIIVGYSGHPRFGMPGLGLLPAGFGIPQDEITEIMGWDKAYHERVAEAKKLMAEAGFPNGFKLHILSSQGTAISGFVGASLVLADALRNQLNIEAEVNAVASAELQTRLAEGNYDLYTTTLRVGPDPIVLKTYFGTGGYSNFSNYANPELDQSFDEMDRIIDPEKHKNAVWDIERVLLKDLPALPTGCFPIRYMAYYPHVRNLRYNNMTYSMANRFEEVWIDESLRVK